MAEQIGDQGPSGAAGMAPLLLSLLGPAGAVAGIGGMLFQASRKRKAVGEFRDQVRELDFDEETATSMDIMRELLQREEAGDERSTALEQLFASRRQDEAALADQQAAMSAAQQEQIAYRDSAENALRAEYESQPGFELAQSSADAYRTALRFYEEGTPTAFTQLARVFEKVIDPTGVVRPGDLEIQLKSMGFTDSMVDRYRRGVTGGLVGPELARDIMRGIAEVTEQRGQHLAQTTIPRYQALAAQYEGVRPESVLYNPIEDVQPGAFLQQFPSLSRPQSEPIDRSGTGTPAPAPGAPAPQSRGFLDDFLGSLGFGN